MAHTLSDFSNSVFASLGLATPGRAANLVELPGLASGRECVLLVDGMGSNAIAEFASLLTFTSQMQLVETLVAPFPSTTVSSLTTFATGVDVGIHGMVGYTMRIPHSGTPERILNGLKWDERVDPQIWQSQSTLFERAMDTGIAVSHIAAKRYEATGFTRAALRGATYRGANSIDDMVTQTVDSLTRERSFAYVYVNDVDEASHGDGFGSERFTSALSKVDRLVHSLIDSLPRGSRLWITSDHGMINRTDVVVLGKDNDLLEGVDLVAGDTRVRYLYMKDEAQEAVISRWRNYCGDRIDIYTRAQAVEMGLFGASVLPNNLDRIGDVIVVARDTLILAEQSKEDLQRAMVGHHGGLTLDEIQIPLFGAEL